MSPPVDQSLILPFCLNETDQHTAMPAHHTPVAILGPPITACEQISGKATLRILRACCCIARRRCSVSSNSCVCCFRTRRLCCFASEYHLWTFALPVADGQTASSRTWMQPLRPIRLADGISSRRIYAVPRSPLSIANIEDARANIRDLF